MKQCISKSQWNELSDGQNNRYANEKLNDYIIKKEAIREQNESGAVTKQINNVCVECGISANVLTCLKKYGRRPDKLKYSCSTYHKGKCDVCGEEKSVTEERDYFFPDFNLLNN